MTPPFALPDWLPWWVPIVVLIPAAIYLFALIIMPFTIMGMKSRLEAIDARLDELHGEIRALSLRLPEPEGPVGRLEHSYAARPPIPPAASAQPADDPAAHPDNAARPSRREPRLDWPR